MLIILFGLSGAGKNFVASILERNFNFFWWDADEALTDEMHLFLQEKKLFTPKMREDLTTSIINKISELKKSHQDIVITQALYRKDNRLLILNTFPETHFIWIKSKSNLITQRLKNRPGHADLDYAEKIKQYFEEPDKKTEVISNNSDAAAVLRQLKKLLSKAQ